MMKKKIAKKTLFYSIAFALSLGLSSNINAQTLVTHDFNDGAFDPYVVNKADQESRVYIESNSVETHWQQDLYNGTNSGRKAQIKPINDIIFTQHIWMGLKIKIHSDYMKDNTNTNAGLMQIWGYNGSSGAANHMCMLKFDGRNGGALVWQHRYNSVANKTHYLVEGNFPRNEFVDVIVHVQLSNYNEGIVQVWVNDELKINKTNQTIGWGDMDATGMINGTYCFGTSIGQYNFMESASYDDAYDGDNHLFDGHMVGETRTVTYDNVSLYNGTDGYDLVDPSNGQTPTCGDFDAYSTIEAESYCDMSGIQTETTTDTGGGENVGWTDDGDWIKFDDVDFGNGAASFEARVASKNTVGTIELRLGSSTGTLIGSVNVSGTTGWQDWTTVSSNISGASGVNDLYVVFSTGGLNLNWIEFTTGVTCATFSTLEAEDFDGQSGIVDEGSNIGYVEDGDWIMYSNVDLTCASSIDVRASSPTSGGDVEVRLGSATGSLIGTVSVSSTGNWNSWSTVSANISSVSGTQDVYLVFTGGSGYLFNLDWIEFSSSSSSRLVEASPEQTVLETEVRVYPNPVSTSLTVVTPKSIYNQYAIYNMDGKIVRQESIVKEVSSIQIDLAKFKNGIYMLMLSGNQSYKTLKLIKE